MRYYDRCTIGVLLLLLNGCVALKHGALAGQSPRDIVTAIIESRPARRITVAKRINHSGVRTHIEPKLLSWLLALNSAETRFFSLAKRYESSNSGLAFSTLSHYGALPYDYLTMAPVTAELQFKSECRDGEEAEVLISVADMSDPEGKVFSPFTGENRYSFRRVAGRWQLTEVHFARRYKLGWPRTTETTLRLEIVRYSSLLNKETSKWTELLSHKTASGAVQLGKPGDRAQPERLNQNGNIDTARRAEWCSRRGPFEWRSDRATVGGQS